MDEKKAREAYMQTVTPFATPQEMGVAPPVRPIMISDKKPGTNSEDKKTLNQELADKLVDAFISGKIDTKTLNEALTTILTTEKGQN